MKILHRNISITILFFFLTSPALAASSLWVTEIDDHQLFLMGSIHVLQKSHYPLPTALEEAYKKCEVVVFEIDQKEMETTEVQQMFLRLGTYPPSTSLDKHLSETTLVAFNDYLATIQLPFAIFKQFKPAYCALVITMMEFERLGFLANYGLDQYYAEKATHDGKKQLALETAAFQFNLFFNQKAIPQDIFLAQTLKEIKELPIIAASMEKSWTTGNSADLYKLLSASFSQYPQFYKVLITDRNKRWVPRLLQIMAEEKKNVLVVVGAGHLVGPESVVELLQGRGYRVKQL